MRANYHPFLFTLMALTAAAELGLTAFLICAGNEARSWASPSYHSLSVPRSSECRPPLTESHLRNSLILLCFSSAWTLLFSTAYVLWIVDGAVHVLAQVASSVVWLLLTSVLWVRYTCPDDSKYHTDHPNRVSARDSCTTHERAGTAQGVHPFRGEFLHARSFHLSG